LNDVGPIVESVSVLNEITESRPNGGLQELLNMNFSPVHIKQQILFNGCVYYDEDFKRIDIA